MKEDGFIPAQLSFFSIYSPPLGPTDETFGDQIVFHYSRAAKEGKAQGRAKTDEEKEVENEKLRQIGLAQGMVGFARNFSDDQPIDSVETEKSRILMHELEKDWWVLASIDLTRLPSSNKEQKYEYSSREVSPAPLLLQQILTAYRIFTLHHGPSLSDMYVKLPQDKFAGLLDRFWSRFCRNWEVLLHGNPAIDIFGGLKLAAGGELGYGVGEEEWGSGDREVLEDLVHRTEGLVDLVVSRFGEAAPPEDDASADRPSPETIEEARARIPWIGSGHEPQAADGLIFGGVGAISRASLRDISTWSRDLFAYGEHAYGVKDNPHRQRRKRRRRQPVHDTGPTPADDNNEDLKKKAIAQLKDMKLPHDPRPQMHDRVASHDHATGTSTPQVASHPGIPPPIVSAADTSLDQALAAASAQSSKEASSRSDQSSSWGLGSSDKWVKYLTFGLASGKRSESPIRPEAPRRSSTDDSSNTVTAASSSKAKADDKDRPPPMQHIDPNPDGHEMLALLQRQRHLENQGQFLIGYRGDLEKERLDGDDSNSDTTIDMTFSTGERNILRTIKVELTEKASQDKDEDHDLGRQKSNDSIPGATKSDRLRVLVYVRRPFVFVMLFEQRAPSLSMNSFYRTLHKHLKPLHKSLLSSTSPTKVADRIAASHTSPPEPQSVNTSSPPYTPPRASPVFDLVYEPVTLTIHTSIPNIPEPGQISSSTAHATTSSNGLDGPPQWTRLEALNIHQHILSTLSYVPNHPQLTELTSKTSRHWWIVWLRVPQPGNQDGVVPKPEDCRTAFLVRKARDHVLQPRGNAGSRVASRVSSGVYNLVGARGGQQDEEKSWSGSAAGALAGGIGVDARRYVEGLLSLNR